MILTTKRLILREFAAADWNDVLAYQSDPLYLRYTSWTQRTPQDVQAFVQMFLDWQQEQPRTRFQLAIVLKTQETEGYEGREEQLIGNCGLRVNDSEQREANIGYEIDSRHWGQGYASEAARALIAFGFEHLGLHRIWSWCVAENLGSARVLEKLGMRPEGCLRGKEWIKGRWHDHLLYALLDWEWRQHARS